MIRALAHLTYRGVPGVHNECQEVASDGNDPDAKQRHRTQVIDPIGCLIDLRQGALVSDVVNAVVDVVHDEGGGRVGGGRNERAVQ